jgi:hypothetical protein
MCLVRMDQSVYEKQASIKMAQNTPLIVIFTRRPTLGTPVILHHQPKRKTNYENDL